MMAANVNQLYGIAGTFIALYLNYIRLNTISMLSVVCLIHVQLPEKNTIYDIWRERVSATQARDPKQNINRRKTPNNANIDTAATKYTKTWGPTDRTHTQKARRTRTQNNEPKHKHITKNENTNTRTQRMAVQERPICPMQGQEARTNYKSTHKHKAQHMNMTTNHVHKDPRAGRTQVVDRPRGGSAKDLKRKTKGIETARTS